MKKLVILVLLFLLCNPGYALDNKCYQEIEKYRSGNIDKKGELSALNVLEDICNKNPIEFQTISIVLGAYSPKVALIQYDKISKENNLIKNNRQKHLECPTCPLP